MTRYPTFSQPLNTQFNNCINFANTPLVTPSSKQLLDSLTGTKRTTSLLRATNVYHSLSPTPKMEIRPKQHAVETPPYPSSQDTHHRTNTHTQLPGDSHIIASGLEELSARLGYGNCILSGHSSHTPSSPTLPSHSHTNSPEVSKAREGGGAETGRQNVECCVSGAGLPRYLHTHILVREGSLLAFNHTFWKAADLLFCLPAP
jgi:hypothetical protein